MPIENINSIDILAERKDNKGVDLVIIASGYLDESAETQTSLLDKIESYLGYINSQEFKDEFGVLDHDKIHIEINCTNEPAPLIRKLFQKIVPWVEENGARVSLTVIEKKMTM